MSQKIEFTGTLRHETEKARLLVSTLGHELWIPKSMFTYWRKDSSGVTFSVEWQKVKECRDCYFDEN